jgi:SsrA-binding protein
VSQPKDSGQKLIATNPNAHANYFVEEVIEAGIVLVGTEIKSIRNQSPNLKDSFVDITNKRRTVQSKKNAGALENASTTGKIANGKTAAGKMSATASGSKTLAAQRKVAKETVVQGLPVLEAWLVNAHVGPYSHGNIWNHEARRRRKLLLHEHQIRKLYGALTQEGKTIVPTRMYYVKGRVKVELALAKGKKKGDKRADSKRKDQDREIDQAMKKNRR